MNLDSFALLASFTHPLALCEYALPNRAPRSSVFDMFSAFPIGMRWANLKFGVPFTHAGLRAEHSRLANKIAGGPVESFSTPATRSNFPAPTRHQRLAGFIGVAAPLSTKHVSSSVSPVGPTTLPAFRCGICVSPTGREVALAATIKRDTLRILRGEGRATMRARFRAALRTIAGMAAVRNKLACAQSAGFRSVHENSLEGSIEISKLYCKIAEERLALVDMQPNLFEKKPE